MATRFRALPVLRPGSSGSVHSSISTAHIINSFDAPVFKFVSFPSLDAFLESPDDSCFFAILHANVRDIHVPDRMAHLDALVNGSGTKFDVLVVTETWLSKSEEKAFVLDNFVHISSPRESRSGGGVSVFIRHGWSVVHQEVKSCDHDEVQTALITISKPGTTISIVAFYSRSSHSMGNLLHALDLALAQQPPGFIILIGDSNINILDRSRSLPYVTYMATKGFEPLIQEVTRPASSTCIDHIWVNGNIEGSRIQSGIVETATLADHFPVFLKLIGNQETNGSTPRMHVVYPRRIFSTRNYLNFTSLLQGLDWVPVLVELDPDIALNTFYSLLFEAYSRCFPLKYLRLRVGSKTTVWFDNTLKCERRLLDSISKRYRTTKNPALYEILKRRRASYRRSVRQTLRKYHSDIVQKYYGKPNKLWQHLNKCMGRKQRESQVPNLLTLNDRRVEGNSNIAEAFCEYFSMVGHNMTKDLDEPESILEQVSCLVSEPPTFTLGLIEPACVVTNARSMKADYAQCITTVPSKVIKQSIGLLAAPLTHIFNLSIQSNTFPSKLKDTTYIPIFKGKGDPNNTSNYRPIAITSFVAKLFERCVVQQFAAHLESMGFFSENQFGFRSKRSTDTALCSIVNFAASNCEGGNSVVGIFLDVAKAFDCVSHKVLFDLMHIFGVADSTLGWFKSYLADRSIVVKIHNTLSTTRPMVLGIPQGSVLGPFIFIYYLNALLTLIERNCPNLHIVTYADDTTLLYPIKKNEIANSITELNDYLSYVHNLFRVLRLSINVQKTRMVLFKSAHCRMDLLNQQIVLDGTALEFSENVECLGLMFSADLKWREHYYKISRKAYGIISTLARLRRLGYKQKLLMSLYRALLEPILFYGLPVWGNTFLNTKQLFQIMQNDALRAIYGIRRHQSVRYIYRQQQLLDVTSAVKFKIGSMVFKAVHLGVPLSFPLDFSAKPPQYELRSNGQKFISQKFCRTVLSEQSPEVAFVKLWNSIPVNIRESATLTKFKREYKAYLLQPDVGAPCAPCT